MKRILTFLFLAVIVFVGCKKKDTCPGYETMILGDWSEMSRVSKNFSGQVVSSLNWNKGDIIYTFTSDGDLSITQYNNSPTIHPYTMSDTCNSVMTYDVLLAYSIKKMTQDSMVYSAPENGVINVYTFIRP
ncbi:MAG: hypothetical protein H6581_14960 [Bacteroidia bacterium]|nr:hypothetical protein [Bacteroidia bacterium]